MCAASSAHPQLTWLHVDSPRINGENFAAFCSAMGGLEELTLQSWSQEGVRSIRAANLAAGFASLRSLHILRFFEMFDEETWAPVLHHAPSLRVLELAHLERDCVPTPLAQLSLAAPLLEIVCDYRKDQEALERAKQALNSKAHSC